MRRVSLLILLASLLWTVQPGQAAAESRIALVIGNGSYGSGIGRLDNPGPDAALINEALISVGFDVMIVTDADLKAMKRAILEFGKRLTAAGPEATGLFYFSGRGLMIGRANYLVPLDAKIVNEADVELEAINLDAVLSQMEYAGNRVKIVIVDASRDNPLPRGPLSTSKGLARMDLPPESYIAFATAPGDVAQDGKEGNSPYARALADAIIGPRVRIEELFRRVRKAVMAATYDRQVPWDSSSLTSDFYFRGGFQ